MQAASLNIASLIINCCNIAPDIVCVDLRAIKKNKNFYLNILNLIKNYNFNPDSRMMIANSITAIILTGYEDLNDYD